MVLGALILALGYIGLAIPDHPALLFPALGLVAVGGGVFKANPANLISKLYEGDPAKIDSAFTMYYMAVNIGATASQLATPLIAIKFGWHAAFAVCAAGLVVGILNYFAMSRYLRHVGSEPDFRPLNVKRLVLVAHRHRDRRRAGDVHHPEPYGRPGDRRSSGSSPCSPSSRIMMQKGKRARAQRSHRRADPDGSGHALLHLLPADVDVAHALLAPQRRPRLLRVRRPRGAGPGAESDLDLRPEPRARLALQRTSARARAETSTSPRSSRWASRS